MAEVFLLSEPGKRKKYEEKMRADFVKFLTVNRNALELHGKWVAGNTMFRPLQDELEAAFTSLEEKLEEYLGVSKSERVLRVMRKTARMAETVPDVPVVTWVPVKQDVVED
jgi:hypothetical protein